jgi:hypothetical protein
MSESCSWVTGNLEVGAGPLVAKPLCELDLKQEGNKLTDSGGPDRSERYPIENSKSTATGWSLR